MAENSEKQGNSENKVDTAENSEKLGILETIYGGILDPKGGDEQFIQGLANLKALPVKQVKVAGKPCEVTGVLGFRKGSRGLQLAMACGKAMVRYIDLRKFMAMVEFAHDEESSTIMLQNFSESEENSSGRGQILGRLLLANSAIVIIQGVVGRVVRGPSDIALFDAYYLDRKDLFTFYLAAKAQISNQDQLETMIAAFDGWKAFQVPSDPLNPFKTGE